MTVLPWVTTTALVGSVIPPNNRYYITTFGGGSDAQPVACSYASVSRDQSVPRTPDGAAYADGTWWYVAGAIGNSIGRWPCGTKVRVTDPATGKTCVAVVADMGPNSQSVERLANGPVVDASPLVLQYLFGRTSYGWSDRKEVEAVAVDPSTPVGPSAPITSGSGGAWIAALSLIAMGVGAAIWLESQRRVRMNPTEFLVRTASYTPQMGDAYKPHLGSIWLKDRKMAEHFATDLSQRNHARVVVEEIDGHVGTVFSTDVPR